MLTRSVRSSLALLALAATVACSSPPAAPPPTGGGKKVDPVTASVLMGKVTFTGIAPAPEPIRMAAADPNCTEGAGPNPLSDAVLITDGGLQNVFVYVKQGLDPAYSFDVPTKAVEIDQHGCMYTPRVLGVRAGQPIQVVNNDNTMHNVHSLPASNRELNQSTPARGTTATQTFTMPEVMVRFKCDVHGWMTAWVGVVAHPFFAVTSADGVYEIKGLPPGTYTIEAWHEKFGTKTSQVTIGEHTTQTLSFVFNPS